MLSCEKEKEKSSSSSSSSSLDSLLAYHPVLLLSLFHHAVHLVLLLLLFHHSVHPVYAASFLRLFVLSLSLDMVVLLASVCHSLYVSQRMSFIVCYSSCVTHCMLLIVGFDFEALGLKLWL